MESRGRPTFIPEVSSISDFVTFNGDIHASVVESELDVGVANHMPGSRRFGFRLATQYEKILPPLKNIIVSVPKNLETKLAKTLPLHKRPPKGWQINK